MINVVRDENDKEWIRRRQMRLIQVRKQSNDIAKQLRLRVNNEKREKKILKENEVEAKLEIWKMMKLKDLNELYRDAVSNIGTAHKLAVEDMESNERVEEKEKVYKCMAKERGKSAMEQAQRERREAVEKKLIPVQRKLLTRQIEDIRSSLVRSISTQRAPNSRIISPKKPFNPKLFDNNYEDKKRNSEENCHREENIQATGKKTVMSSSEDHITSGQCETSKRQPCNKKKTKRRPDSPYKTKTPSNLNSAKSSKMSCPQGGEVLWVNLGTVEAITEIEDNEAGKTSEAETMEKKHTGTGGKERKESREKIIRKQVASNIVGEEIVECRSFSVRHRCNLKNDIPLVRRVDGQMEPDPTELAMQEEKQMEAEKAEKQVKMLAAAERAGKAIEKEKITRNYNDLIAKLEKLSAKEKIIKTYCHIPPPHTFMSDERRREKLNRKQRAMESKFEKIYYEIVGTNSNFDFPKMVEDDFGTVPLTEQEESKRNPRTNSPVTSSGDDRDRPFEKVSIKRTDSSLHFKRTKISRGEVAIADIDRLLKRTRKLREESHRTTPESEKKETVGESIASGSVGGDSSDLGKSVSLSPCDGHQFLQLSKGKESKREEMINMGMGDLGMHLPCIRTETIAWPVHQVTTNLEEEVCSRSSTTSYRGVPSQILPKRINSLLKLLVQLKEREGRSLVADELIVNMEETLDALIKEAERSNLTLNEEDCREIQFNPQLNYYITKLLSMSRERVANLNVASESEVSVLRGSEGGSCDRAKSKTSPENKYLKQTNRGGKCANMKRAKELEQAVLKWEKILRESCDDEPSPAVEDDEEVDNEDEEEEEEEEEMEDVAAEGVTCVRGDVTPDCNTDYFDRYEEVSKKCSECISGLSSVLANVRKEVNRAGPSSTVKVYPYQRISVPEVQRIPRQEGPKKEKIIPHYESIAPKGAECLPVEYESIPDIMDLMLGKGLITSPFHWDGPKRHGPNCPDLCGACERKRKRREKKIEFHCLKSCKGACHPMYNPDPPNLASDEAGELREIRKKLEKVPMKYLDSRYGVFSPVPVPKPFSNSPEDEEFFKKNFGQPLFGLPVLPPDPNAPVRPRSLYFKVVRNDNENRPSSEPQTPEADRTICDYDLVKRPRSTPGNSSVYEDSLEPGTCVKPSAGPGSKHSCPATTSSRNNTGGEVFEDSLEPGTCVKPSAGLENKQSCPVAPSPKNQTCKKAPSAAGLDNKYFQPVAPSPKNQTCQAPSAAGLDNKYFQPVAPSPKNQTCQAPSAAGLDNKYFQPVAPSPKIQTYQKLPPGTGFYKRYFHNLAQKNPTCPNDIYSTELENQYFRPAVPRPKKATPSPEGLTKYFQRSPEEQYIPPGGLPEKYFRPATPSPEPESDDSFRCADESPEMGVLCQRPFTDFNAGARGCDNEQKQNKLTGSCAGTCAVHCKSSNHQLRRSPSPGREGACSATSVSGYVENPTAGRRSQGGCPYQGDRTYMKNQDCSNTPEENFYWAEDFL